MSNWLRALIENVILASQCGPNQPTLYDLQTIGKLHQILEEKS